jgi:hypothetical protein
MLKDIKSFVPQNALYARDYAFMNSMAFSRRRSCERGMQNMMNEVATR